MKKAFIILASVSAVCIIALGILTGCLFKSVSDLKDANNQLVTSIDEAKTVATAADNAAAERIAEADNRIASLESDNKSNKQTIENLKSQLAICSNKISELKQANEDKDDEIYLLTQQCEELQKKITEIENLIMAG